MEADNIEILFIDYEDLFESKIEIKKFLNILKRIFSKFPIRKTRLS